jgi:chitinase
MNRMSTVLRTTLSAVTLLLISTTASAAAKVVAYVPNWVDLKAFADTIDYAKITHIDLAFENPTNDDGDLSFNRQDEFLIDKARAHGVKILVSIGGGSASGDKVLLKRYGHLLADENRAAFVAKIADYLAAYNFDGLDVDIEGPAINKDYGAFVSDLAKVLHEKGLLLTAALSQGYGGKRVPNAVFEHFDFVNIMAYDGAGYWDPKSPGQHSSLAFAKSNVAYWLDRGLPKSKAVLGVPFYGYGFGVAFRKRDYAYAEIVAAHPSAENADQAGNTIWYNGIPTIKAKAAYVVEQGLGGVMIWSLDNDVKGERSLLSAIHETLSAPVKPAPATKPD